MDEARPTILIPGRINAHVRQRVQSEFNCISIETADASLVQPHDRRRVRGIAAMTEISAPFIDAFDRLEIIGNFGVGYDAVDAAHAARRGVMVTYTPDVLSDEVADTTIGLVLNTLRRLPQAEAWLRSGRWLKEGAFPLTPLTLRGRTAGIFGLGRIGLAIARRLEGFGIPVHYHNRTQRADVAYPYHATLRDLAEAVDLLICVVPGGESTEKAVGAEVFAALGENGVFINVGRGTTVDEPALIKALEDETIAAAGLDVFADEPRVPRALMALDNACLLPHVASASVPTRNAMGDLLVDNLVSWFSGGAALTPVSETRSLNRNS
ncbi:2-hydroxyacid dehydrogenase [Pseudohoeflea coraliihabitans]|uniref:2-hydroxyacid dehydrogenase n=1 Tax=Pseudohoeflea coraliihabitans TaxID=2860393 RepID=A0ABS6WMS9_9HYPH|nr:2-hydroxyacid dehydrogenase [Pseudohoeflea sp. DP4N28-3]MBW3096374.1 2-hydroxyacid dehydrogenase [Pseudohoeflea sp. DP4N28-3]